MKKTNRTYEFKDKTIKVTAVLLLSSAVMLLSQASVQAQDIVPPVNEEIKSTQVEDNKINIEVNEVREAEDETTQEDEASIELEEILTEEDVESEDDVEEIEEIAVQEEANFEIEVIDEEVDQNPVETEAATEEEEGIAEVQTQIENEFLIEEETDTETENESLPVAEAGSESEVGSEEDAILEEDNNSEEIGLEEDESEDLSAPLTQSEEGQAAELFQTTSTGSVHIVKSGDTLYNIAKRYGITEAQLRQWNNLGTSNTIYIGQQLVLNPPQTPPPPIGQGTHIVKAGDTLYNIAERFGVTVAQLRQWNNLGTSNLIHIGQQLVINPTTPAPQPPPSGQVKHTVKAGDTLYNIAKRYGITEAQLRQWNNLGTSNTIYIGQQLVLNPPQTPPPPIGQGTHIVKAGDTLYNIAERFGVTVAQLRQWNNLGTSNLIHIGQRLVINPTTTPPPPPSGQVNYTVKSGDTLYNIANRYGVTVAQLRQWNNLGTSNLIHIGQRLVINPTTTPPPPPSGQVNYTVKSGDTLYNIANRYGVTVAQLRQWNNLGTSNLIHIGQRLVINPTTTPPPPPSGQVNYTVKSGDTLYNIANRYGVTVAQLRQWNNLGTSNLIHIGQRLVINPTTTPPPPPSGQVNYTVKSGDTLYNIANRYGVTVAQLRQWNNLGTSNLIHIGQRLVINPTTPTPQPPPTGQISYTVKAGDTLYAIAGKYGVTVAQLRQWNNLGTSNLIHIGQRLVINPTTPAPNPQPDPGNQTQVYTVKSGDTLYSIGKKYGVTAAQIRAWNNLSSNIIYVGNKLLIHPQTNPGDAIYYTVKSGETLYSIARRYGISVAQLKDWNQLTSNTIHVGDMLFIVNQY